MFVLGYLTINVINWKTASFERNSSNTQTCIFYSLLDHLLEPKSVIFEGNGNLPRLHFMISTKICKKFCNCFYFSLFFSFFPKSISNFFFFFFLVIIILHDLTLCCRLLYFSIRQKSSIRKVLTFLECLPVTDVSQAFSMI